MSTLFASAFSNALNHYKESGTLESVGDAIKLKFERHTTEQSEEFYKSELAEGEFRTIIQSHRLHR